MPTKTPDTKVESKPADAKVETAKEPTGYAAPATAPTTPPPKMSPKKATAKEAADGPIQVDFVVDSVLPTGTGAETFTVILRADEKESENNGRAFTRASGRVQLNNVRSEVGKALEGKTRVTLTITPTA